MTYFVIVSYSPSEPFYQQRGSAEKYTVFHYMANLCQVVTFHKNFTLLPKYVRYFQFSG